MCKDQTPCVGQVPLNDLYGSTAKCLLAWCNEMLRWFNSYHIPIHIVILRLFDINLLTAKPVLMSAINRLVKSVQEIMEKTRKYSQKHLEQYSKL